MLRSIQHHALYSRSREAHMEDFAAANEHKRAVHAPAQDEVHLQSAVRDADFK